MEKKRRKMVGRLDTSNPAPKWHKTIYLENGKLLETIHDGEFSPFPSSSGLVFVPAEFCDELPIMNQKEENPQQISNGSYKYIRAAFIGENGLGDTNVFTVDGDDYEAETKGVILINNSTLSDFSASFQAFLAPYKESCSIVVADARIEDFLESGVHTLKIKNNGEESETMTFTIVPDYMYFEAAEANSTFSMISFTTNAPNLEYSTDCVTWQEWQHTYSEGIHTFDAITLGAIGDRVYLRGDNPAGFGVEYDYYWDATVSSNFLFGGKIRSGGNIMSLIDKDMEETIVPDYGFMSLFQRQSPIAETDTSLLNAPRMDAITAIGHKGCLQMFSDCSVLASAADMPALATIGDEGCLNMYYACMFDMSDDGSTLNFAFPTPPVTAGETTYSTAYDVANWMGNTNGFNEPQPPTPTTPVYQKVTSAPADGDWSGEYLIVTSDLRVLNGSFSNVQLNSFNNTTNIFTTYFNNNEIPATVGQTNLENYSFTISGTSSNLQLLSHSGFYLYAENYSPIASSTPQDSSVITTSISFNSSTNEISILLDNSNDGETYSFFYNGSDTIRYWASDELDNKEPIYLYKKVLI